MSELDDKIEYSHKLSYKFSIIGCPECGGKGSYRIDQGHLCHYEDLLNELDVGINEIVKGKGKIKCSRCNGKGFL